MKKCQYCGQMNDETVQECQVCGSLLESIALDDTDQRRLPEDRFQSQTRMDYHQQKLQSSKRNPKRLTWKLVLGISLIVTSLVLLGCHYWFNDSKPMVSRHFQTAMRRGDYAGAARFVTSPLVNRRWTEAELSQCLANYQAAGVDLVEEVQPQSLDEGVFAGEHCLLSLERSGHFLFLPQYRVVFHPIKLDLLTPNQLSILSLKTQGQASQDFTGQAPLVINPSVQQVRLTIRHQGHQEEVEVPIDYQQFNQGHIPLSLYPVENRLLVDQRQLGLRPNFPFAIQSLTVDGKTYFQDEVILAGYTGQVFQVSFMAEYNHQVVQSQPIEVTLVKGDQQTLDFSGDSALKDQLLQAEK